MRGSKVNMVMCVAWLLVCLGCSRELPAPDYVNWMHDPAHGLAREKEVGAVTYALQYMTPELSAAERGNSAPTAGSPDGVQFRFRIHTPDGQGDVLTLGTQSEEEVSQRKYFLMFQSRERFRMVCGTDTVPAGFVHMEQTYQLAPHLDFLVGFPACKPAGDREILIEDLGFMTGRVKFLFQAEDIAAIPALKPSAQ